MLRGIYVRYEKVFPSIAIALGAWFHYRNLKYVVYLAEDESRAFRLDISGQFLYLVSNPLYQIFREQYVVFYIAATFGFLSICLFYIAARNFLPSQLSSICTLFYAICPARINFARTLFPQVYMEFFFLLVFVLLAIGLTRKNIIYLVFGGLTSGILPYVHYYSYAAVLGLYSFGLIGVLYFLRNDSWAKKLVWYASLCISGLIGLALVWVYIYTAHDAFNVVERFLEFSNEAVSKNKNPIATFASMFLHITRTPQNIIIIAVAFVSIIVSLWIIGRQKEIKTFIFLSPTLFGFIVYLIGLVAGYAIFERHFTWMLGAVFSCIGIVFYWLLNRNSIVVKRLSGLLLVVFILLCAHESYAITQETFKISSIRKWLDDHDIKYRDIATSWWQINKQGGTGPTHMPPGGFTEGDFKDPGSFFFVNIAWSTKFWIHWPELLKRFNEGESKYLLTSGLDLRASLGSDEIMLKHVRPIASWKHPYIMHKRRPYGAYHRTKEYDDLRDIELYDLRHVFSQQNFRFVQEEVKKFRQNAKNS